MVIFGGGLCRENVAADGGGKKGMQRHEHTYRLLVIVVVMIFWTGTIIVVRLDLPCFVFFFVDVPFAMIVLLALGIF